MHGCDFAVLFPSRDELDLPITSLSSCEEVVEPPIWTLHTPPLRYEVDSMQHWLDLNA